MLSQNYLGYTIGSFIIIGLDGNRYSDGSKIWRIKCRDCGLEKSVSSAYMGKAKGRCVHGQDFSGKMVANYRIIGLHSRNTNGNSRWLLKCPHGGELVKFRQQFGAIKPCDCDDSLLSRVFGKLTVIIKLSKFSHKEVSGRWKAKCLCGRTIDVHGSDLLKGNITCCGCSKNLAGTTLGKIKILGPVAANITKRARWNCKCECGTTFKARVNNISPIGCGKCQLKITKNTGSVIQTALKRSYQRYQLGALARGYAFTITFDFFSRIVLENCHYCNTPPTSTLGESPWIRKRKYLINGIDRKDPKVGYLLGNCLPCCPTCNFAKHKLGYDQFLSLVQTIAKNHPCLN